MTVVLKRLSWVSAAIFALACGDDASSGSGSSTGSSSGGTSGTGSVATTGSTSTGSSSLGDASSGDTGDPTSGVDSSSSSGSSGGTDSSGSGSSSGGGSSSSTGGTLLACIQSGAHYGGALCGTSGPCVVELDEEVDDVPAPRPDDPAIIVDTDCTPRILTAAWAFPGSPQPDPDAFTGLAIRGEDGVWSEVELPEEFNAGGLDFDAVNGQTQAVVSGGPALGARLWLHDQDGWQDAGFASQFRTASASSIRPTGDETVNVAVTDSMVTISEEVYDGAAWSTATEFQVGSGPRRVHLGGADVSQASWRVPCGFDGERCGGWRSGDDFEGTAISITGFWPDWRWLPASRDHIQHALAVDADSRAHVLTVQGAQAGSLLTRIERRDGPSAWTTFNVATDQGTICALEDAVIGETCQYDYVEYRPLELVAGGAGEVLGFLAVAHRQGTVLAQDAGGPYWTDVEDDTTYALHVAWLEDGVANQSLLLDDRRINRMSAFVDDYGRVHVALAEGNDETSTVSYLRIAAP